MGTSSNKPKVPVSNGFFERLGCDVLHFPTQRFVLCSVPSVYNPHDLLHLHYPQFFTPEIIAKREAIYPVACRLAKTVVVGSEFVKQDVLRQYGTSPEKIQVIPEHPPERPPCSVPTGRHALVAAKYNLDRGFALYPAATWPHKNHLGLLDALAQLRDRYHLRVPLVCTGYQHEPYWAKVAARVEQLRLAEQVRFLGYVSNEELGVIYELARLLVQPSLFEASSLPVFDAWRVGLPVTCSDIPGLTDQVSDAALLFDPERTDAIAEAIRALVTSDELRANLRCRGRRRLNDFDPARTALAYRAVYRRAGCFPLTAEDRHLLQWDWMRHPHLTRNHS